MTWEDIARLPREQLLTLLRDTLKNLTRIDGYWFLVVEQAAGQAAAAKADEEVWRRFGRVDAFQTQKNFHLEGDGIPALVQALRYSLVWPLWCDYQVEQTLPTEAVFRVLRCGSQVERVKAGLGVFPCRGVEAAYFTTFAQAINPRLQVTCLSCPPEDYREDLWCQWQFRLEDQV